MTTPRQLTAEARKLAELLQRYEQQIVFAESCTGGLVAATLTQVPGISDFLCGSAVVYQIASKHKWLGIPNDVLEKPGPVSRLVATQMAERILENTPQANLAVAVTGHLGPHAPKPQDGLVYVAISWRQPDRTASPPKTKVWKHRLEKPVSQNVNTVRVQRQRAAAEYVLSITRKWLEERFRNKA